MKRLLFTLMLLPSLAMATEPLGRLFTTPAERANLDYLRQTEKVQIPDANQPVPVDAAPAVPSSISVQGYVRRSDGKKSTVWVNHTPMQENSDTSEVEVGKLRDGNQVQLKLPANGKKLSLKPGQVYIPETDSVSEMGTSAKITKSASTGSTNPASRAEPVKSK